MAATPRRVIGVSVEDHERLARLSQLMDKPIGQLVSAFARNWEGQWRGRMSDDEFERYLKRDVSFAEAMRIRQRGAPPNPGLTNGALAASAPLAAAEGLNAAVGSTGFVTAFDDED
jgi:hypothetical protein